MFCFLFVFNLWEAIDISITLHLQSRSMETKKGTDNKIGKSEKAFAEKGRMMLYTLLFTALIILGSYISIPMGPVPVLLSTLFIYCSGLLLGKRWGTLSVALYVLLRLIGLPVFSGGSGGLHHIYGPTGGYLLGFIVAAFLIGWVSENNNKLFNNILALVTGSFTIHTFGILWLSLHFPSVWEKMSAIYWVYMIADTLKIVVTLLLTRCLQPIIDTSKRAGIDE